MDEKLQSHLICLKNNKYAKKINQILIARDKSSFSNILIIN